jgi:hypothetical protein
MKFCIITFRSVTPAQRAENLLRRAGFECSIQRTPRWIEEQGCGYSLRVRLQDAARCAEKLQEGEIPYRKIYLRRENGSMEELTV